MGYLTKNLLENEKILFQTKKHWIIFVTPVLWAIATILCFSLGQPILQNLIFFPAIMTVLYSINRLLVYFFSEFAVTDMRVMMREGFFFRHINDTRMSAIANVNVVQDLIGQGLNYGTIFINSFGGERDPFRNIALPLEFKKVLQEQLFLWQQNKKPMT